MSKNSKTVGVIIGRFQTPYLHDGHRELFKQVMAKNHDKILVLLGCSKIQPDINNPMDCLTRETLIRFSFRNYLHMSVKCLYDTKSDRVWSENIDKLIEETFPNHIPTLYGSRGSFIKYYSGKFSTEELPSPFPEVSATKIRNGIDEPFDDENFRKGIIYAVKQLYPTSFQVIDIAVTKGDKILLGKKAGENNWRFIGGFVDTSDKSLEAAASRELKEEVGDIVVGSFNYIGSTQINDWRYSNSEHSIMSSFYQTAYVSGVPVAQDDIVGTKWVTQDELLKSLVPEHQVLGQMLIKFFLKNISKKG